MRFREEKPLALVTQNETPATLLSLSEDKQGWGSTEVAKKSQASLRGASRVGRWL